jgi:hypothetical protein
VKTKELLLAFFVFFTALLVWPLVSIANRPELIAGVPALAGYLFVVWIAIVVVLAWAARHPGGEDGS